MVSFLLSVVLFIITIPMKTVALGIKAIKAKKNVEKVTGVDKIKRNNKKKKRESASERIRAKHKQSKAEQNLRGIVKFTNAITKMVSKGLITLMRGVALLLSVCGMLTTIITSLSVVMLVATMSGLFLLSTESGDFNFMSNTTKQVSAESKGQSDADAQKAWLDCVIKLETEMAKQNPKYAKNGETTKFKWDNKEYTWRYDCSGTVSLCLQIYNNCISSPLSGDGFVNQGSLTGFTKLKTGEDIIAVTDLKPGDIMCCAGHVEVVESIGSDGKVDIRSWGDENQAKNGGKSSTTYKYSDKAIVKGSHKYTVVWRAKGSGGGTTSSTWTIYAQGDSKWGGVTHGTSTIAESGCGTCATAMVLAHYSGDDKKYTPDKIAKMEREKGTGTPNKSTETIPKLINECYKEVGLTCSSCIQGNIDLNKLDACLAKGGCAIVDYPQTVGGIYQLFAQGDGHYVVITSGSKDKGYHTVDSNNGHETGTRGKKEWTPYSKHTFEAKYIKDARYYYLIEK